MLYRWLRCCDCEWKGKEDEARKVNMKTYSEPGEDEPYTLVCPVCGSTNLVNLGGEPALLPA